MTGSAAAAPSQTRIKAKYLLFAALGLVFAYVLAHNERFLIDKADPEWPHIQTFKWWLLPHAIGGACALILAPMQFSERLRNRFRQLHRVVGYIYCAGVLIAAPLGFYIQHFEEGMGGTRSFSVAAGMQAINWTVTTAIALFFILRGKTQLHRQWMTRSFAVALVFLEVRIILGVTGWDQLPPDKIPDEAVVWFCNVLAIPMADIALQWRDFWTPTARRTQH